MIENWLKHAHPGLPRMAAWLLAWLVLPLILPVAVALELATHGVAEAGELFGTVRSQIAWLWRQRPTPNTDPWKQIR
jgi:hypothetical protein